MVAIVILNSLWPSDAIWRQGSRSTLVRVMVCCLTAPGHYLNNVDLSSVRSSYIHLMAISQEIHQSSVIKINMKITHLKCHYNLPGANELTGNVVSHHCSYMREIHWLMANYPLKELIMRIFMFHLLLPDISAEAKIFAMHGWWLLDVWLYMYVICNISGM